MFEWNEDEEVRDTIWGVINEAKNNLVSCPKRNDNDTSCTFIECKRQRHGLGSSNFSGRDQRKHDVNNDFPGSALENNSNFSTNEELSASRFDMDTWPDLPSLNPTFSDERTSLHPVTSKFINDDPLSSNMETITENMVSQLYDANAVLQNKNSSFKESCSMSTPDITKMNSEPDIYFDEHNNRGDSFLNDWASITDFDDFDRIFRNHNTFGHETIGNADEILSSSMDADRTTVPSFSMTDTILNRDENAEKDLSTFQMDEQFARNQLKKDNVVDSRIVYHPQHISKNCGIDHQLAVKQQQVDRRKKLLKSQRKIDLKSKKKQLIREDQHFEDIKERFYLKPSFQPPSTALGQSVEEARPGHTEYLPGTSQHFLPAFEYPMHVFPMVSMLSPAQLEGKQNQTIIESSRACLPSEFSSNTQPNSLLMTPEEKVEKLRRRQQMQAVLAIQQQQQQFGQQNTSMEMSVSQTSSQMNPGHGDPMGSEIDEPAKWLSSSQLNMKLQGDNSQKSLALVDDLLGEAIFFHLYAAIEKLDVGVRLCVRDSLLRLARSATERLNTSDRTSMNKNSRDDDEALLNEERNSLDRSTRQPTETGTNPIDRTVAHMLFHWPSKTGLEPVKDKMFSSPTPSNPASRQSNAYADVLEDKAEKTDELDALTSM